MASLRGLRFARFPSHLHVKRATLAGTPMMRIELNTRRNAALFSLVALALAAVYLFWVQRHYRAASAAESLTLAGLQQATRLEPDSAEFRDILGRFYLFVMQDNTKSLSEFEQATRLDPSSSRYWLDLANAESLSSDVGAQRKALQRAIEVDPKTPSVAWEAANFFLVDGNTDAALKSLKTVIEYDPVASRPALDLTWRATHDIKKILTLAMPAMAEPHVELLQLMMEKQQTQPAVEVWRALMRLNEPIKAQDGIAFAEYLIRQRQIDDAKEVWGSVEKLSPSLRPATADGNLIVNGNFEEEIVTGGFSWHLEPPAAKSFQVDDRDFHSGTASASLNFEGPAFSDYGLWQWVPVRGNQMYELRYTTKSQEIISANGPRIMVEDAFTRANLGAGPEMSGTHGWNEETLLFSTKPDTRLVRVYVGRAPADSLIRGKLWIDDMRMYER